MPPDDAFGFGRETLDVDADYANEEPATETVEAPIDPNDPEATVDLPGITADELEAADVEPSDAGDPLATPEPTQVPAGEQAVVSPTPPAAGVETAPATAPATQEPPGAPAPTYAGRFANDRDLEQGYLHVRALHERTAAALAQQQAETQELRGYLQQAATLLQSRSPGQPQAVQLSPALVQAAEAAGLEEGALKLVAELAGQEADRRMASLRGEFDSERMRTAQQAQALQADQARASAAQIAQAFTAAHPDVVAGNAIDQSMQDVVDLLELDPMELEMLEVAYEAAHDPKLLSILRASPDFVLTEEGMGLARTLATVNVGTVPATQAGRPGARTPAPAPHVEKGPSAAPTTPGGTTGEDDEIWGPVLELARQDRAASVFGV